MEESTTVISKSSRTSKRSNRSNTSKSTNKNDVESIKETEEKRDILDRTCTSAAEELFGTKVNSIIALDPEFIAKMEEICDVGVFPSELLLQLKNSGINTPHILVNTFGGGIATLAKQIMFMKVSIFLDKHPNITIKLIAMSRSILRLNFNVTSIFPQKWMTIKKTKSYDTIFLAMDKTEVNNHQELIKDP